MGTYWERSKNMYPAYVLYVRGRGGRPRARKLEG